MRSRSSNYVSYLALAPAVVGSAGNAKPFGLGYKLSTRGTLNPVRAGRLQSLGQVLHSAGGLAHTGIPSMNQQPTITNAMSVTASPASCSRTQSLMPASSPRCPHVFDVSPNRPSSAGEDEGDQQPVEYVFHALISSSSSAYRSARSSSGLGFFTQPPCREQPSPSMLALVSQAPQSGHSRAGVISRCRWRGFSSVVDIGEIMGLYL